MSDEQLESFLEKMEALVTSMQERIEKLEKHHEDAVKNTPFHLGLPMREYATRETVGFKGNGEGWRMPRESSPQL